LFNIIKITTTKKITTNFSVLFDISTSCNAWRERRLETRDSLWLGEYPNFHWLLVAIQCSAKCAKLQDLTNHRNSLELIAEGYGRKETTDKEYFRRNRPYQAIQIRAE